MSTDSYRYPHTVTIHHVPAEANLTKAAIVLADVPVLDIKPGAKENSYNVQLDISERAYTMAGGKEGYRSRVQAQLKKMRAVARKYGQWNGQHPDLEQNGNLLVGNDPHNGHLMLQIQVPQQQRRSVEAGAPDQISSLLGGSWDRKMAVAEEGPVIRYTRKASLENYMERAKDRIRKLETFLYDSYPRLNENPDAKEIVVEKAKYKPNNERFFSVSFDFTHVEGQQAELEMAKNARDFVETLKDEAIPHKVIQKKEDHKLSVLIAMQDIVLLDDLLRGVQADKVPVHRSRDEIEAIKMARGYEWDASGETPALDTTPLSDEYPPLGVTTPAAVEQREETSAHAQPPRRSIFSRLTGSGWRGTVTTPSITSVSVGAGSL